MIVRVTDIHKSFKNQNILKGVSFEASSGQIVGIIGANGCGKTTLLSILAGTSKADAGEVFFEPLTPSPESPFGYIPQINPLPEGLRVKDCLDLWCASRRIFDEIVLKYELTDFIKKMVDKLSGGMKRRTAIACAMAAKPEVLIMDEPTSALDITYKELIHRDMRDFVSAGGIIIMVTHEAEEIAMCDVCYRMEDGVLHIYEQTDKISENAD